MSSSDSSDEESAKLMSAVDPDFKLTVGKLNGNNPQDEQKPSIRSKLKTESQEKSVFRKHPLYSLDVTPDCQKFLAKHLSLALEKQIKEIRPNESLAKQTVTQQDGIYLFSSSSTPLCEEDLKKSTVKKRKKPKIKRRKCDKSDSEDEDSRLKSVAVTSDWVLKNNF